MVFFRITFFLGLFTYPFISNAQLDSLKIELKKCKSDTSRVNLMNEISYYTLFNDVEVGKQIAIDALDLATKINFERGILRSYGQLGNAYNSMDKYDEAIEAYLNCLRIAVKMKDIRRQSVTNHNIGLLYLKLDQYKKAEEYILAAIEIDKKVNDKASLCISYNSMGSIYFRQAINSKAKYFFNEALKLVDKQNPSIETATVYSNMGAITRDEGRYGQAKDFFKKAIEIHLLFESSTNAAKNYVLLADLERKYKHYEEAIINYEEAVKLVPDLHLQTAFEFDTKTIFSGMAEAYMMLHDYKKSAEAYAKIIENFDLNISEVDSVQLSETKKAFAEMATKYETEKKDAELRLSQLETDKEKEANAKKNIIIYSIIGGGLLLVISLIFVYRSYLISKALARKIRGQKEQIEKQHDEISHINKEITASIEYAKNIQNSILPDLKNIDRAITENFVLWLPRDIVSGDFYWFHETDDEIFLAAADCTGHGVPGAFVSVSCVNILNQVVIDENHTDPGKILSRVHQHVCDIFRKKDSELKSNDGMDIALCKLNKHDRKLHFAGAMNPLVIVRNSESKEYKADRSAIGGRTPYDFVFETKEIEIQKNDSIYLYSDGFKDQFGGPDGKKYLNKRFLTLLENIFGKPMSEQHKILDKELKDWCGNYARIDDVLVVGMKIT
jgi:serine phosphatase RsbU (regulator of sigma subunit)/Tfp pilus assembly protein PilF